MKESIKADCDVNGYYMAEVADPFDIPREGNRIIAAVCNSGTGNWHFYYKTDEARLGEAYNFWRHKPGDMPTEEWDIDLRDKIIDPNDPLSGRITDPLETNYCKDNYDTFLGFYEIGPNAIE